MKDLWIHTVSDVVAMLSIVLITIWVGGDPTISVPAIAGLGGYRIKKNNGPRRAPGNG